ncbi:MAG TPA: 50S ribosomal protein L11 methyltransferase [Gemmatimonadaceae bacterium]|nr:50S ribosomal protein L11 methyltransferase [Gemmatimonadaceae bacterium]
MSWHMLRVRTARPADVSAALFDAGALALQEQPGSLTTHFLTEADARSVAGRVALLDPAAELEIRETPDADYSRWRASVGVWEVGAVTVAPPWLAANLDPARTVVIDPAMAFGTGEHATTRGALTLMQRVVRAGDSVADLGTGSGVLAIAAAKLGAVRVVGIEHEAEAVGNAEANVEANGVAGTVKVIQGDAGTLLPLVAPVRVVLANIASLALLQLMPVIAKALTPDGEAVISGILTTEAQGFRARLSAWRVTDELAEDDWWTAALALL